jgi:hypothetical protein
VLLDQKKNISNALDLQSDYVSQFLNLDLPAGDSKVNAVEEDVPEPGTLSSGLDGYTLLMVEVAVVAFVGAFIISLIEFLVYKDGSKGILNHEKLSISLLRCMS